MAQVLALAWLVAGLNGILGDKPWALSFSDLASFHLESCLGAYPVDFDAAWTPPDYWDADDVALEMPEHPNMVAERTFPLLGALKLLVLACTSLLLSLLLITWFGARLKSMAMLSLSVAVLFSLSLGFLQTVQRAEFWGAIVALQAYWPCHLGIDNLNVVRSIGRPLDADCLAKPHPLVKDGDLVALVQYMVRTRGRDTVRVTKVKGHAKDGDVQHGHVRLID